VVGASPDSAVGSTVGDPVIAGASLSSRSPFAQAEIPSPSRTINVNAVAVCFPMDLRRRSTHAGSIQSDP
jgi:hypothetical protein